MKIAAFVLEWKVRIFVSRRCDAELTANELPWANSNFRYCAEYFRFSETAQL